MINHIPSNIRNIKIVDMAIRLSVAMTINIVYQFRYIEEKMLFISSWGKCLKKSNGAKNEI